MICDTLLRNIVSCKVSRQEGKLLKIQSMPKAAKSIVCLDLPTDKMLHKYMDKRSFDKMILVNCKSNLLKRTIDSQLLIFVQLQHYFIVKYVPSLLQ